MLRCTHRGIILGAIAKAGVLSKRRYLSILLGHLAGSLLFHNQIAAVNSRGSEKILEFDGMAVGRLSPRYVHTSTAVGVHCEAEHIHVLDAWLCGNG